MRAFLRAALVIAVSALLPAVAFPARGRSDDRPLHESDVGPALQGVPPDAGAGNRTAPGSSCTPSVFSAIDTIR